MRRYVNLKFGGTNVVEFVLRAPNGLWHGFHWYHDPGTHLSIDLGFMSLMFYGPGFKIPFIAWLPIFCLEVWIEERPRGSCK